MHLFMRLGMSISKHLLLNILLSALVIAALHVYFYHFG